MQEDNLEGNKASLPVLAGVLTGGAVLILLAGVGCWAWARWGKSRDEGGQEEVGEVTGGDAGA